jgi:DNA-binding beta-propeller fold protein YncE
VARLLLRILVASLAIEASIGSASAGPFLWQTSSEGDDIRVFDLQSRQLVRRLVVGPEPHGIAAPADARVVYVTLEANDRPRGELLWIDPRAYRIRHRMEICREPHAIATTPDGRWIYVPCRDEHYWVIDSEMREVSARIRTGGRPHNVRISHDGRLALLSPMGDAARVTVVDVEDEHEVVGEIAFGASVRPSALSDDGRLFQHVDGLNGFQVADVARGEVVATVEHGAPLGWLLVHPRLGWLGPSGLQRCHGLAVRPGHHEVWSACGASVTIHDITDSTYPELARVPLASKAYWLTFSPDGRWALVALSGADQVAVVDAESRDAVAQLSTGPGPKRNLVIDLDQVAGTLSGEARYRGTLPSEARRRTIIPPMFVLAAPRFPWSARERVAGSEAGP